MQIVFNENGTIETTRSPHTYQVLKGLGQMHIERMTDIKFNSGEGLFYIEFLTGPFAGLYLSNRPLKSSVKGPAIGWCFMEVLRDYAPAMAGKCHIFEDSLVGFNSYEDAVAFEVIFVEYLRDMGYSMR